ncbi:MAG: 3'(2'),5'-bisphosphate nucleotidase CysQ [Crocinitomicaceae bacterium]
MKFEILIEKVINSGIKACFKILEIYHKDFEVYEKADLSPVTEADLASTKILEQGLSEIGLPIISEEKEIPPFETRKKFSSYFLIDPLDGTKEFIGKTDEFCINVALVKDNEPVLGFIFDPIERQVIFGGTFLDEVKLLEFNEHGTYSEKEFDISNSREENDGLRFICSRRADIKRLKSSAQERFESEKIEIITKGSALKFIDLALGRADYYLRFGKTMEWDIAPGFAILKQLKGSIDHVDKNVPLEFNKENLLNPPFIAYKNR